MRVEGSRGHRRHRESRHGEGAREENREALLGGSLAEHPRERRGAGRLSGAKTFRRGRAIAFLEQLETKRDSLKKQLTTPELQSINPQIVGELKAIDMVIAEFIQVFELQDDEGSI